MKVREFLGAAGLSLAHWSARGLARNVEQRSDISTDLRTPEQWLMNYFGARAKSGATVSEHTAFNVSTVRACVNVRANLIAMLPLRLYQRTARGPEEQTKHSLSKLLKRKPGPAHTSFTWRHSGSVCFDIGGQTFSRLRRNSYADLEAILWTKPSKVRTLLGSDERLSYDIGGQSFKDFEMFHLRNLSLDGYAVRSPLHDLRESVGLALTAEEFAARSFANGNRKPGVFVGKDTMDVTKATTFLEWRKKNYAGAENAGKDTFVWGGIDWRDAGFSNLDAELLMTRKFSVEEIARVYHLPLPLIGSTEKSTTNAAGIEQFAQLLVDYTLTPLCRNWEQEMDDKFLTEQEKDDGYFIKFAVDALLRGSFETRAKIYQIMRGICAMDVNQIRSLEDWELYPDAWAGDPRLPMNNQGGGGNTVVNKTKSGAALNGNPDDQAPPSDS